MDIFYLADNMLCNQEERKVGKNDRLALEVKRPWLMKEIIVIPIVVKDLETVSKCD